ncbi:PepSY domain-containing protein [Methylophaga sp. OBS4]|uniref:PepSY domain-containing protein n=1 Tax=Methylophaga sp. OBS4 TaxID=2991935 RepID=UPI00225A7B3F|nr:PepSY domain-containing protein [Methylophaga sp. OBS4]MCX4188105.1 PepSY domain-containing protein [Methylophaga sp. OBS4]
MTKTSSFFIAITALLAASLILPGSASSVMADQGPAKARQLQQHGKILALEQIIDAAIAIKPGQILETELERDDGRYFYELEILDAGGQVWELEFDAQSGDLIELELED